MDDNLRSGTGVFQRHTDKEVQMLREFNTSLATDNLRSDLVDLMQDMSIRELSRKSSIGTNTICRLLKGGAPNIDTVVALFEALGKNEVTIRW